MKNLITRTITGAFFVTFVIGSIIWNKWIFAALFLIFSMLGLWEFFKIFGKNIQSGIHKYFGLLAGAFLFSSITLCAFGVWDIKFLLVNIPLLIIVFIIELFSTNKHPFINISLVITGIFYIVLPFSLLIFFFNPGFVTGVEESTFLLGFFILIWSNDTFAYLCGSILGKHKLFERISPKKTWEGSIGGAVLTVFVGFILSKYFVNINVIDWIIISIIIVITATIGDLIESMLKRSLKIKDTGNILPGHGGVLDRFDAVFVSAPFVLLYLVLFI
ncbi:MAG: phosphatidate cytidylyltransferase [Bacteroidales bacterium]|nr:phosphatidate cytidylyltransferase [Bacteroidales bacterium]